MSDLLEEIYKKGYTSHKKKFLSVGRQEKCETNKHRSYFFSINFTCSFFIATSTGSSSISSSTFGGINTIFTCPYSLGNLLSCGRRLFNCTISLPHDYNFIVKPYHVRGFGKCLSISTFEKTHFWKRTVYKHFLKC